MAFLAGFFGRGGWGLLVRRDFFDVMVGGRGGVAGSKELMGWVGSSRLLQKLFPRRTDATSNFVRQFGKVI